MDDRACYGKHYGHLAECDGCEEAPWCMEARDPKPLTGPTAGANGDGDAAYEAAEHNAPTPQSTPATTEFGQAARAILEACEFNPARVTAVMFRLAGLTYQEIGNSLAKVRPGKTRQAVLKDLAAIQRRNPTLGKLVRQRFARPVDPRSVTAQLAALFATRAPIWPGRLTGPDGLYAILARECNVCSWQAVRMRVERVNGAVYKRVQVKDVTP